METGTLEGFRLSPSQQRVWALESAIGPMRTWAVIKLDGELDVGQLKTILQDLVERYEILHTSFQILPGMTIPLQVVGESLIHIVDPVTLNLNAQSSHEDLIHAVSSLDYDIGRGPIMQALILSISEHQHYLMLVLPTLCADTMTLNVLMNDIVLASKHMLPDEINAPQYIDIAEWQHELLDDQATTTSRHFWKSIDLDTFHSWKLPDEWYAPTQDHNSASHSIHAVKSAELEVLCETYNLEPQAVFLAAWLGFIARTTDQISIPLGVLVDGRKFEELSEAVGLLARYLPLSVSIDTDDSLIELAQKLQSQLRQIHQHQEGYSADVLVSKTSTPYLFSLAFEYEVAPVAIQSDTLTFNMIAYQAATDLADIVLRCSQHPDHINLALHSPTLNITSATLERLSGLFEVFLAAAIAHPEQKLQSLSFLSVQERSIVIDQFNPNTFASFNTETVVKLICNQAQQNPSTCAVIADDGSLTYAELLEKATNLAYTLRLKGITCDDVVGLLVERTTDAIVGIVGIWLAGGAYLPIDPSLPRERVELFLHMSNATVVVSQKSTEHVLPEKITSVGLDDLTPPETTDELPTIMPEQLAYTIYTSGSTGQPKGVAVEHRQLAHYVQAVQQRLDWPEAAQFAVVSTLGADLGHTALFPTLCTGGTVHLISSAQAMNADLLGAYMQKHHIDGLKIVPSHLAALMSGSNPSHVIPSQRLIFGGEAISWDLVRLIKQLNPTCQIFNHYGPTETTVGVIACLLSHDAIEHRGVPPLGKPLDRTQIYLLDEAMQPVPVGIAGEIYIGGAGVTRGYLNQASFTADRFVPHPFSSEAGARLYRTGDLGVFDSDGTITFLGRSDDQIKLRGYRIELGEIAAVLRTHAGVKDAVVIAHKQERTDPRLIAYIVPQDTHAPTFRTLRNHVKAQLPEYMIPSAIVVLEQIPLTANGKLDRKALPLPEFSTAQRKNEYVAPQNPVEEILVQIWNDVLPGKQIGINDNFFDLGGDSIISIQIVARASQKGLSISPKQLFMHPTIAGLAKVAELSSTAQAEQGLIEGAVPLTPIQQWFFDHKVTDLNHYNQAVLFELDDEFDPELIEKAFQHLIMHHDVLRLKFTHVDSEWKQEHVALPKPFSIEMIDLSDLSLEKQSQAIEEEAEQVQARFDLSTAPLLQVAYFKLGHDQPARLLIVAHHLVVDNVSWMILLDDFASCYQQLASQQAVAFPAKTSSYKQWAEWLLEYAQSPELTSEAAFWINKPYDRVKPLPQDTPQEEPTEADNQTVVGKLSVEETGALKTTIQDIYAISTEEIILAGIFRAVSEWSNSSAVLIELEGHGREDITKQLDLTRTVGWFTSRYPLLLSCDLEAEETVLLKTIKEQVRSVPQRGISYGILRYLNADPTIVRQLQAIPQPEIVFMFMSQYGQTEDSSYLRWANESVGALHSSRQKRLYTLEINSVIQDDQLKLSLTYSKAMYATATMQTLVTAILDAIRLFITAASTDTTKGYTPSDFPKARLDQQQLDKFLNKFAQPKTDHEHQ